MAYDTLKGLIRQYIKTNGQNQITGQILQNVLIAMVDEYPALTGYATQTWVQNWVDDQDFATEAWVNVQGFLRSDTVIINSVVRDADGSLQFMGPNFETTIVDLTHTHRFEELTDLPSTLQDYGITDAASISMLSNYLPLSGGTITGAVSFQYEINPEDPETAYLTIEDGVITLDSTGKIQNGNGQYYFDNNGNAVFNSLTIGGYTAATQNWVNTQLLGYATQSWVSQNYLPTSTVLINGVSKNGDGGMKFVGRNFTDTYLDLTHTHRFEELTDLPTTLQDYGITDAYISSGTIYLGGNNITPLVASSLNGYATQSWVGQNYLSLSNGGTVTANITSTMSIAGYALGVSQTGGEGCGISLYGGSAGGNAPTYGIMFANTQYFGTLGAVTGDKATYFTMDNTNARGWIFRRGTTNVCSIGNDYGSIYTKGVVYAELGLQAKNDSNNHYLSITNNGTQSVFESQNGNNINTDIEVYADNVTFYTDGYVYGNFQSSSDLRLKNVLEYDVLPNFEAIANAPSIRFTWNDLAKTKNTDVHIGSIAQYWQNIMPEAVVTDKQGYLSMSYDVIAMLATISVAKRVADHERRVEQLELENAKLRLELNTIKERVLGN